MPTKKPTNEQVAKWVTRGTTVRADKVLVLYNDGETALVKWPSGSTSSGGGTFRDYCPAWVEKYSIHIDNPRVHDFSEHVWDCSRTGDGPMTEANLKKLVHRLKLNELYMCYTRPNRGKQEVIRPAIKPKKERRVGLETRAVKVCMFISGFTGDLLSEDCEAALDNTKIVGELDETGQQINGEYLVLMYESLTDLVEFFKYDREKILDTLESFP